MGRQRVTLQTLADQLGVSRTTASNAFSRPDQLSDELRTRVLDAARELGYAGPDPAARTLRAGTAGAIGVLLPESLSYMLNDPYASAIMRGLAYVTDTQALSLLLIPVPPGQLQEQAVRRAVVDAFFIFTMPAGHPALDIALCRNVPVVTADSPKLDDHPFIGADEYAAGREIAAHVLAAGRRRLGVITFRLRDDEVAGDVDDDRISSGTYRSSVARLRGVLDAANDAGVSRSRVRILEVRLNAPENGRHAAAALLDGAEPPDAILCLSDQLAAGAMQELTARGMAIPDDVAVTGWDDTVTAQTHGLTTMRQPDEEKARIAAQWLIDGVQGARRQVLPTQLVVRESTSRPAKHVQVPRRGLGPTTMG
jgi:DNA-binding LacI/PurR family transcriptional regulator